MQNIYRSPIKKSLLITAIIALTVQFGKAQSVLLPYSYQLDQKFNSSIYSVDNSFHTALKPFLVDSILTPKYNQIMNQGVDSNRRSWVMRKIFNEHLFDVKTKDYTFYADFLPDLMVGRDFSNNINTNLNTRGYQLGGTIGDKFFFYSSGYENAARFPAYYQNIINSINLVPGMAYDRDFVNPSKADWSYVTAIVSYTPIKQVNITMGEDKTFIGDGYRSLLLSDFSPNTPLLRLTANLGKVQYMIMWDYMEDPAAVKFDSFGSFRRKWGGFHYLDWNVTNRLSLGYFNAVIAEEADDLGHFHGFDANFLDPLVYSNALNSSSSQPDHILTGFTGKYKIFNKTAIYAQVLLDRFSAGSFFSGGTSNNTNGFQVGIRGADLAGVANFNYLFEYNTVRPYTYASTTPITSYSNYDEPLGDPFGANFHEFLGILNYSIKRFDFMGEVDYVKYGADVAGTDYGMNVMEPFVIPVATPVSTTQGVVNNLYFAQGTVSYLINPKTNLRFEAGAILRDDKSPTGDQKTVWLTFGLRSTFRQIYNDL